MKRPDCQEIEFIYFDMGNVLMDFDHRIGTENVARETGLDPQIVHDAIFKSGLQAEYETGKIRSSEFVQRFIEASGCQISEQKLLTAVSDIFAVNRSIIPLLTQLRAARFPIGILSNTCEAHWNFILNSNPILKKVFDLKLCVLSFRESSLKPDTRMYESARQLANVPPEKIFFCDDLQQNVDGAVRSSMQAKRFTTTAKLVRDLIDLDMKVNL